MANYRSYPTSHKNYPRNQKTVRTKKEPKVNPIVKYFKELGTCLSEGSTCLKLSTVFMGLGHIYNYQFIILSSYGNSIIVVFENKIASCTFYR